MTIIPVLGLLLGPFVVGAVPSSVYWALFIGSSAIVVYAFASGSGRAKKITLALASVALTITICDLALRLVPLMPDDLVERWPRMPLVSRYIPELKLLI
jgi:hypothetical protein